MSFRLLSNRLFRGYRILVQHYQRRTIHTKILQQPKSTNVQNDIKRKHLLLNQGIYRSARRLFFDNIFDRASNSYPIGLNSRTTRNFFNNNWRPFFALVGVSLVPSGILTKEEELESACYEIREAVFRYQQNWLDKYMNETTNEDLSLEKLDVGPPIAKGCSGVVYSAKFKEEKNGTSSEHKEDPKLSISEFPLALKIMFNYDIESNALAILRAMHKETVPARHHSLEESSDWQKVLLNDTIFLPPHPNIVGVFGVFCDRMPQLRDASTLFPSALPPRLNSQGYGRNMSLFLLMKRYDSSLRDFLAQTELSIKDRVMMFTQLLEAATHLNRHGVAHRDLKSDNILLEINEDSLPVLVLSDFGCCIAEKQHGLQIPYSSGEINKGGNTALMAPEILSKEPGPFSVLDYCKSDLWACGTIAYEIFGQINPFYCEQNESLIPLRSLTYKEEDLPKLNDDVPYVVRKLVQNILQKNPRKRVSTDIAANIMQLYLWAPSSWMKGANNPSNNDIIQWLLCLTTKMLCDERTNSWNTTSNASAVMNVNKSGRRAYTEYLLISSFLARARLNRIRIALNWLQDTVEGDFQLDISN